MILWHKTNLLFERWALCFEKRINSKLHLSSLEAYTWFKALLPSLRKGDLLFYCSSLLEFKMLDGKNSWAYHWTAPWFDFSTLKLRMTKPSTCSGKEPILGIFLFLQWKWSNHNFSWKIVAFISRYSIFQWLCLKFIHVFSFLFYFELFILFVLQFPLSGEGLKL